MPNWTDNILIITGPQNDIQTLRDAIEKRSEDKLSLDFNGTVPMPKELENTTSPVSSASDEEKKQQVYLEKFGAGNWYDWRRQNWGVKWNASDAQEAEITEDGIIYRFQTPWNTPFQWIIHTAEKFPTLTMECWCLFEGGESAAKYRVWTEDDVTQSDDEKISDHDYSMKWDPEYNELYTFITEGDYDEVLEQYQEDNEIAYSDLEKYLLERIKDEDLPLFINFEWYDKDRFEERFRKCSRQQSQNKASES